MQLVNVNAENPIFHATFVIGATFAIVLLSALLHIVTKYAVMKLLDRI